MPEKLVFHLPERHLRRGFRDRPHLGLFARMDSLIAARGGTVELRARTGGLRDPARGSWDDLLEPENLHIIENGVVRQANALNAALAYLPPFVHLDPAGCLAFSSAAAAPYDAGQINPVAARSFYQRLQNRFVTTRRTRYNPPRERRSFPKGCIAVFLQGVYPHNAGTAFCDTETMLRTVASHADGRPVVVKAHPVSNTMAEFRLVNALMQEGLTFLPTDANIHDILANCAVTVSYNSAVAIEGMLHGKPAILFGASDFHHVCETVHRPEDFPQHLSAALSSQHDYARYLYWYFNHFCLSLDDWDLDAKLLTLFESLGFDAARLGLTLPAPSRSELQLRAGPAALREAQEILGTCPEIEEVKLRRVLKLSNESHVFLGRVNGEKRIVKRFFGPDAARTIHNMKAELDLLHDTFGDGDCQANRCIHAWPDLGLAVLSHAPGKRLEQAIADLQGPARAKVMRQSGRWLARYTATRRREATFGPLHWVRRASETDLSRITDPADRALMQRLLSALHTLANKAKGKPLIQAATHGDFVGINAHYHQGVIYGVDIQGECWLAVAREAARFLVWQRLHDTYTTPQTRYGLNRDDWRAFLASDVLDEHEKWTTLPFFVGEQLFSRFAEDYGHRIVREEGRKAITAFLEEVER